MIFTRTKRAADRVAEDLDFRGFGRGPPYTVTSGRGAPRERALRAFRVGKIDVLVATGRGRRAGLDVTGGHARHQLRTARKGPGTPTRTASAGPAGPARPRRR